jgi:hypothetical protein
MKCVSIEALPTELSKMVAKKIIQIINLDKNIIALK